MILPRRRVASLLLAFLLIAGPLAAATHRPHEVWQSRLSVTGLLSEAWDFMSRILGRAGSSTFPFEKEGGSNDPFGKSGSSGDPFGKSGGSNDPFGNPKPTSQPGDSTSAELASGK
jgi:hypothetical protein